MAPPRNDEEALGAQPPSPNPISWRNSIASRVSDVSSLSDIYVADGFRPNPTAINSTDSSSTTTPQQSTAFIDQSQHSAPSDPLPTMRNRPSSVAKPHRPHESLTLRHEHNNASTAQPSFARASIASSEGPMILPDSPYRGPTGPSHPYQMYPQRTLSNATASTAAPLPRETPAETQQGPQHPYSLYTQSTTAVEEPPMRPAIPVGFTSLPDNYRRQLGPDGEEAGDLIGPMGHTEELPPYTRYPEIAFVGKGSSSGTEPISTPSSSTPDAIPAATGAGGIGRATRDPEFSSTEEDLPINQSRQSIINQSRQSTINQSGQSIRSQTTQNSRHSINTAARGVSEKPSRKGKWQRIGKRRLWGIIPYWAICLLVVGTVVMGIIIGAVVGTILTKSGDKTRKAIADSGTESPPKAPVGEVVPYTSVPDDLDPITTGFFGLPPLDKDEAPRKCFNNSMEFNAWSCDIPYRFYSIDITEIKNASKVEKYDLELTASNETDAQFIWGTQPPSVPKAIPLKLVNDTFDMGRGPAWWLNVTYTKTVIVPEANFPLPERRAKRGAEYGEHPISDTDSIDFDLSRLKKTSTGAVEGDRPWICTWPDTTLEIFIYPNVEASLAVTDTEPDYEQPTPDENSRSGEPTKLYPKVVKFLERRLSGDPNSTAICQQVLVVAGGTETEDCYDEDGELIRVEIVETATAWEEQAVANQKRGIVKEWYGHTGVDHSLVRREAQELTSCGCLWWST